MVNLNTLAEEISEQVQTLHWRDCRCKGCKRMVAKRADLILETLKFWLDDADKKSSHRRY